jgi:NAD(P)-dependent dehydrogenase (short-subunit alcohol dehydrogenase family)
MAAALGLSFAVMPKQERVVLVTGASSGFGRLIAELLARKGYTVFATMRDLAGRNARRAEELRVLASLESLELHPVEMDVTKDASVERSVGEAIRRAGRIDVLVNNAGMGYMGLTESFTLDQARLIFDTNVFGPLRTIRAVLPQMHRQGSGLLIQISSGAGRVVLPSMALYCSSKFALEALTDAYRYELADAGIDCLCVQPGAYPTEIFGKLEGGADPGREEAYGKAREFATRIGGALSSSTADPMEIAEAVLSIIETPAESRKSQYRIGKGAPGVEEINAVAVRVQEQVLSALEVSDLARFRSTASE